MSLKQKAFIKPYTIIIKLLSFLVALSLITSVMPKENVFSSDYEKNNYIKTEGIKEFKLPDIIEKNEQDTNHYVSRIKDEENDLYTMVFKNEDGTNTMRIFSHPVKYIDKNEEVQDISLDIIEKKGGTFKSANHIINAEFGEDIIDGISLEYDDVRIEMFAENDNIQKAKSFLSDDTKKISYIIDEKTSYVYSLTYSGIKEDIIVSEYTGQTEYNFTLFTNGLHPITINDSVFLADNDNNIKASIGDIVIFSADEKNNCFGDWSYEPVIENSEYIFTIILDKDYLKDEKTLYPLTIDPTIEINYSNGSGAIEDVTINSLTGSDGTSSSLYIGKRATYGLSRVLMKFPNLNLSHVLNPNDIISASVEMRDIICENESMNVSCFKFIGNSWTENTATWTNVGADNYGVWMSSNNISYNNGATLPSQFRYSFNIAEAVRDWKSNPNNIQKGILFKADSSIEEGATYIHKTFASYNRSTYQPSVTIKYDPIKNYTYVEDAQIEYSYRTSMTLTAGQNVTFSTGKATSYADVDTVIHLFSNTNPSTSTSWANDDYNGTRYSQISVQIPTSGTYTLLVRALSPQTGYCNVYKNGVLLKEDAKLHGYQLYCESSVTGMQNFFTANNTVDTVLYIMDSSNRVVAFNDDYDYDDEPSFGDFNWGTSSRVRKNMASAPSYVYVSAYSQNQSGTADIYANCLDGYYDLSNYPNLKPIDSIQAASSSNDYNCFAWAGGIMDDWFYPAQSILTPWYNSDKLVALENFLGNNPPRYAGAITYVYTTNANESIVDVYKKDNNWVHASVRKPGNNMPHGYDWESKMGNNQRIFHPRNSLEEGNYGIISRYYKFDSYAMNSGSMAMTFEQSVSNNKTQMNIPSFSNSEIMFLHKYKTELNNSILNEFDIAYCSWINSIKNNKELNNTSNAFDFMQVPEFNCVKETIKRNPVLYLKVMDLYLQNQDIYSRVLFEATVVLKNERTIELANQIREEKNSISRESINSNIYIAPSFKTNAIAFIKEVISNSSYYLERNS